MNVGAVNCIYDEILLSEPLIASYELENHSGIIFDDLGDE